MSCEEWQEKKFGEITKNYDYKRIPLSSKQRSGMKGVYPYYGAQGIIDHINQFLFNGEYLLIAEDGENLKTNKQNIARLVSDKFWINNHSHIVKNNNLSDLKFLYYLFNNTDISGYITGSVQPKLSQSNLNQISFLLPSLPEQQAIVTTLSCLDDKIELNNRMNKTLEEIAQAIFKSWFVDFEPWNGIIPDDWRQGTFSALIDTTLGGDWGKDKLVGNNTKEVYCIRGADIPDVNVGNKGKMPIRYILPKNFDTKHLEVGDIVIEISGGSPTQSTGRCALITQSLLNRYNHGMVCTNFCRAIKPLAGYSQFIYFYLRYLYAQNVMFTYENGTTGIKNFNINGFLDTETIFIPPFQVVNQFSESVGKFIDKIFANGLESETLATARDAILPCLMSGKIQVSV